MIGLREKIAIELNWYSEPYKDWQTLSEAERALWQARADALLDLIMTEYKLAWQFYRQELPR